MKLFALFLFPLLCSATSYYLSTSIGSDVNTGTSPTTPWLTTNQLATISLTSGSNVYFCFGELWSSSSISNSYSGVTYDAYDCGNGLAGVLPVITVAVQIPTSAWSTSGSTIIADLSAFTLSDIRGVFIDGTRYIESRYPNLIDPLNTTGASIDEFIWGAYNQTTGLFVFTPAMDEIDMDCYVHSRLMTYYYAISPVYSYTSTTVTIDTYANTAASFYIDKGYSDNLDLFDAPREYIYSPTAQLLYVQPLNSSIASRILGGQAFGYFHQAYQVTMSLTGSSIVVQNLNLQMADTALQVSGSSAVVSNVQTFGTITYGIFIEGTGSQVLNCQVVDSYEFGIKTTSSSTTINGAIITNVGIYAGKPGGPDSDTVTQGIAIVVGAPGALVNGSMINNVGYVGIEESGGSSTISNNQVYNAMLTLLDGGAFYTQGQSNSQYIGNVVVGAMGNSISLGYDANEVTCYYSDFGSQYLTYISNTCDQSDQCFEINEASDITLLDNTCYVPGLFVTSTACDQAGMNFTGNTVITHGTDSDIQNPLVRIQQDMDSCPPSVYLSNNTYISYATNGNYLWQDYSGTTGDRWTNFTLYTEYSGEVNSVFINQPSSSSSSSAPAQQASSSAQQSSSVHPLSSSAPMQQSSSQSHSSSSASQLTSSQSSSASTLHQSSSTSQSLVKSDATNSSPEGLPLNERVAWSVLGLSWMAGAMIASFLLVARFLNS